MTRLTGLITHNWPLKLGAIALATLLYAGLALSQNARVWPGRVPIEAVNQPSGAFLLESLGDVTTIRYYAPPDVATRISSSDFQALVDLSSVTPAQGGAPVSVPVQVVPLDPRIKVLDFQPDRVAVRLDPVITRTVPITVDRGTVPAGLADRRSDAQRADGRGPRVRARWSSRSSRSARAWPSTRPASTSTARSTWSRSTLAATSSRPSTSSPTAST